MSSPSAISGGTKMAKKFTVLDFLSVVGVRSDNIPVTIKYGTEVVCKAKNLRWLSSHGMPYELEAKVKGIDFCRDSIVIRIQPKSYSTKI